MAPDDPTPDVLSSLPHARPQRRSAKRDGARAKASAKAAPRTKASAKAAPRTKDRAPGPAGRAPGPKGRSAAAPGPRSKPRTGAGGGAASAPRPARIPPAGFQPPRQEAERGAPSGAEIVGTAIQAAGELAQIGVSVGTHALRSALGRLGRG